MKEHERLILQNQIRIMQAMQLNVVGYFGKNLDEAVDKTRLFLDKDTKSK